MAITLTNFEKIVDSKILQRGKNYFRSRKIIELENIGAGKWEAAVAGSYIYQVSVIQKQDDSLICDCDCPYDYGVICKHIIAVLYEIKDRGLDADSVIGAAKSPKSKREKIRDVLNNMSKDALVEFVADLAKADRQLSNRILAQYSSEDGKVDKAAFKRLIESIISSGYAYNDYLDYMTSRQVAKGIYGIVQQGEQAFEKGDYNKALTIFQAVLETTIRIIPEADDSDGEIGNCLHISTDYIAQIADKLSPKDQVTLFDYCLKEAIKDEYKGWDWGWDIAHIAAKLVNDSQQRHRLYDVADTMAQPLRDNNSSYGGDFISKFRREQALNLKLTVIQHLDTPDDVHNFLHENIDIERFRIRLIEKYIEEDNLAAARSLCEEWLTQNDKTQFIGLRNQFLDYLQRIAKQEDNPEEHIKLTHNLLLSTGNMRYFYALKEAIAPDDWVPYRTKLLNEINNDNSVRQGVLSPQIYIHEEMWSELLTYVQTPKTQYLAFRFRHYLEPHFPEAMAQIYENHVRDILKKQVNRKGYQEACFYLEHILSLGREDHFIDLTAELREKYKNRPAFLDELSKL